MPRLPNSLLRRAHSIHPYLPLLLRPCRTLDSARNELRWLDDAARTSAPSPPPNGPVSVAKTSAHLTARESKPRHRSHHTARRFRAPATPTTADATARLDRLVRQRARGTPLQYLLGTEIIGPAERELTLLSRPGVFIPRASTAAAVAYLAERCQRRSTHTGRMMGERGLRILDLCCGTGTMSLFLAHELAYRCPGVRTSFLGVDSNARAVRLARANREKCKRDNGTLDDRACRGVFTQGDVLADGGRRMAERLVARKDTGPCWDVVLANPPYVSRRDLWSRKTERSVRCFEPRGALLPPRKSGDEGGYGAAVLEEEDVFYPAVLRIARRVHARVLLMEVGDLEQAVRVAGMAMELQWAFVEIWRDELSNAKDETEWMNVCGRQIAVTGKGEGRSVVCWMER